MISVCSINEEYFVCIFRDRLIEQLTREIQALKEELESFRLEVKMNENEFPVRCCVFLAIGLLKTLQPRR